MAVELDPGFRRDDDVKKGGRPQNKSTEAVRAFAATTGTFTRTAVREALGLDREIVDTAIDTLIRTKRLRKTGKAVFEWIPEKKKGKESPLEERIWHAMRINPSWSAADIAVQAGTTVNYVYKRLRAYRALGLIKKYGQKSVPQGSVRIWKLTLAASAKLQAPRIVEYSPDPMVVAVVKLNRLVCSGLTRFVDERAAALRLCLEIEDLLVENTPEKMGSDVWDQAFGRGAGGKEDGAGSAV